MPQSHLIAGDLDEHPPVGGVNKGIIMSANHAEGLPSIGRQRATRGAWDARDGARRPETGDDRYGRRSAAPERSADAEAG